jgi:hypothetical protein
VSARSVFRLLAAYLVVVAVACGVVRGCVSLRVDPARRGEVIASVWRGGALVARSVVNDVGDRDAVLDAALAERGARIAYERVVADGPVLTKSEVAFAVSLVASVDGVRATLDGHTAYVTPDDLLVRQAYDKDATFPALSLSVGADIPLVLALLSERLHVPVSDLQARAKFRRIRVVRTVPDAPPPERVTAETLDAATTRSAALDAARYLARGVGADGRYRYMVDATTNRTMSGYDWPRHAGATFFLAQAAGTSRDPMITSACLRAANLMRTEALASCGDLRCVGTDPVVDLGASSLALLAFSEVVKWRLDESFRSSVVELARFARTLQRPDGEFMHQYDRAAKKPIDVQLLYYSGEATLALARAASVTNDPADLDAAKRGLAHLVGPAWSFFGDRYYFGEEHWTCQAMDDLWSRAPDPKALDFCLRWAAQNRAMQMSADEAPYDVDGSLGLTAIVTPRFTPVASRCEAAVATLDAAKRAGVDAREIAAIDRQLRRSLALLVRAELRPGPSHLFADPGAVFGAMPGSAVDWALRIDYAQHAGSAMMRWLEVTAPHDGR